MIYVVYLFLMTAVVHPSWVSWISDSTYCPDRLKMTCFCSLQQWQSWKYYFCGNFFCCERYSLKSSPSDPVRGSVPERKWHCGPKWGSFVVGMPPMPHCPMTYFMQAPSQFAETNCASSVSIKTNVPQSLARAALEVNWPQAVCLPSPKSGGHLAGELQLSKLGSRVGVCAFPISSCRLSFPSISICLSQSISRFSCVYLSTHNEIFHSSERGAKGLLLGPHLFTTGPLTSWLPSLEPGWMLRLCIVLIPWWS